MLDFSEIDKIVEKIKSLENEREILGKFLKEMKNKIEFDCKDVLEKQMIAKIEKNKLINKKIIAIDGGLSHHVFHGFDLIFTRAVAVIYNFRDRLEIDYYPKPIISPTFTIISDPYTNEEVSISSSLERQKCEIDLANEAKKFEPDLILLDGSVIPYGNDKPAKNSNAYLRYEVVLNSFRKLLSGKEIVIGCVEDSRSKRFCEIISRKIENIELRKTLSGIKDTDLLFHVLDVGERTCVFKYSSNFEEHPILNDLGLEVYCFYLKTAEFDRPVRVEFVSSIEDADKIASIVMELSCNSQYGCPAPIIEADFRAKITEKEAAELRDRILNKIGICSGLMKLRREQRPI